MPAQRDLDQLAPKMRACVKAALAECEASGLDAYVYEAMRDQATQTEYYRRGVTRAKRAASSWHFYGLAVDVISRKRGWSVTRQWRADVTRIFKKHGLDWGGDWKGFVDPPHYQFGTLRASPSARARQLYNAGGLEAVWREVGAL